VWQHFYELKTKRSKGFKNTKWLRHFVFWYNSHYQNLVFESPIIVGFQKPDFVVPSAFGAGNNKIWFIMRIAGNRWQCFALLSISLIFVIIKLQIINGVDIWPS
jgi:hypothetical protein